MKIVPVGKGEIVEIETPRKPLSIDAKRKLTIVFENFNYNFLLCKIVDKL